MKLLLCLFLILRVDLTYAKDMCDDLVLSKGSWAIINCQTIEDAAILEMENKQSNLICNFTASMIQLHLNIRTGQCHRPLFDKKN